MKSRHMNNISLLRRAVKNWRSEYVSQEVNRANQRAWIKAVQMLGDKWLLARPKRKGAT